MNTSGWLARELIGHRWDHHLSYPLLGSGFDGCEWRSEEHSAKSSGRHGFISLAYVADWVSASGAVCEQTVSCGLNFGVGSDTASGCFDVARALDDEPEVGSVRDSAGHPRVGNTVTDGVRTRQCVNLFADLAGLVSISATRSQCTTLAVLTQHGVHRDARVDDWGVWIGLILVLEHRDLAEHIVVGDYVVPPERLLNSDGHKYYLSVEKDSGEEPGTEVPGQSGLRLSRSL